jgi:hypothetical protein
VPEHSLFGHESTAAGEILVAGIADAVALDAQGAIETIEKLLIDYCRDRGFLKPERRRQSR